MKISAAIPTRNAAKIRRSTRCGIRVANHWPTMPPITPIAQISSSGRRRRHELSLPPGFGDCPGVSVPVSPWSPHWKHL